MSAIGRDTPGRAVLGNLALVSGLTHVQSYRLYISKTDQLSREREHASEKMTGTGGNPGYARVVATQPVIGGNTVHLPRGGVVATVISSSNVSTGVSVP